jgi:hypothetical protein
MQCHSCGKKLTANEATPGSTNTPYRAPGPHGEAYTHTTAIWLCPDCANYRRGTRRLVFLMAAIAAVIILICILASMLVS